MKADDTQKSVDKLKLINSYDLPWAFRIHSPGNFVSSHATVMYYRAFSWDYVTEIQGLYSLGTSGLVKLSLSNGETETILFDGDMYKKRSESTGSLRSIEKDDKIFVHYWSQYSRFLLVSPDGKYALFRLFPKKNELYEIPSGKFLSCGVNDEIILGFDHDSNIYCGGQSLENLFVLRNSQDMSLLRKYQTKDPLGIDKNYSMNFTTDNTDKSRYYGIQFSNCDPPITTPDGRYAVLMFTVHQFHNRLALLFVLDNQTNTVIHRSSLNLAKYMHMNCLFRNDGKVLGILDGTSGIWFYDFEKNYSRSYTIPETNPQYLTGFCFTPDDYVVFWMSHPLDTGIEGTGPTAYRLDLKSGESEEFTDFSASDRHTQLFFFSPDGKTVITFEKLPGRYMDTESFGRYVFWDFPSKKRLLETEETYLPNIIIAPDWKTIYLTKTTYRPPTTPLKPNEIPPPYKPLDVEVYDITGITERED